jgi:nicotinamidase-related amidase
VWLQARPQKLEIDLHASALVVVDMQNDFCHPEGWFGQKGVSMRATRKPIPMLQKLLPLWRAAGGRVVWLNWGVRPDRLNLPPGVLFKAKVDAQGQLNRCLILGEPPKHSSKPPHRCQLGRPAPQVPGRLSPGGDSQLSQILVCVVFQAKSGHFVDRLRFHGITCRWFIQLAYR